MDYKQLYILVEGNDDERFFERIIKPCFLWKYDNITLYKYATQPKKKIEAFLKSITAMKAQYIVAADNDQAPCITTRKEIIKNHRIPSVDEEKVLIVIKEIESWYLAGLMESSCKKLGIKRHDAQTDDLSKEDFEKLLPQDYSSRIDFLQEMLKVFQINTAVQNNKSFAYFVKKYALLKA